jgi:penicillin V acylase-like amidase (Ntn superfamily)
MPPFMLRTHHIKARACLTGMAALISLLGTYSPTADACTRILWNDNKLAVVAGRTMDWPTTTDPVLTVLPRGMPRDGGVLAGHRLENDNPARWTSKYGSIVTTVYGIGTVDGVNEKGVAMHMLYFVATDFGPRDPKKQGLQAALWGQYVLDNAASVAEALKLLETIQPLMVDHDGIKASIHLAIEDATGDSAVIEYVAGKPMVYHGREYRIMTNDPSYPEHVAYRATFNFDGATRQTAIPGNVDPMHRYVRADYYRQMLPEPKNDREAIAGILAIARNVSVPFGAPNKVPGSLYNTEYRTAIDLTNRQYYFELTTAPSVIWANLTKFDLGEDSPVLVLDPDDINLSGDVSKSFKPGKVAF